MPAADKCPQVIAIGQSWPDLDIEDAVLAEADVELIDGRKLAADHPNWRTASGVLLGTAHKLDRERIEQLAAARGVVRFGIGYDNVDVPAAEEHGIVVAIVRDYCINEVAEHALASALTLARGLPFWDRNIRAGQWRNGASPVMHRLSALSLGIVGYGLIGRALAEKARGLYGRVLVYDPVAVLSDDDRASGFVFLDNLDAMLEQADALSVHVPLIESTRGMIDAKAIARMKRTAYVINVSRGGIIDEAALLDAVRSGRLAGAALDTFVKEPISASDPLLGEPGILLSPHVAWLSREAEVSLRRRAAEEMAVILSGRLPSATVTHGNTRLSG